MTHICSLMMEEIYITSIPQVDVHEHVPVMYPQNMYQHLRMMHMYTTHVCGLEGLFIVTDKQHCSISTQHPSPKFKKNNKL